MCLLLYSSHDLSFVYSFNIETLFLEKKKATNYDSKKALDKKFAG